jgi:hypothetical protein
MFVLVFGPYRRRRFVPKFAMPNFPAGPGNVFAHSDHQRTEDQNGNGERRG